MGLLQILGSPWRCWPRSNILWTLMWSRTLLTHYRLLPTRTSKIFRLAKWDETEGNGIVTILNGSFQHHLKKLESRRLDYDYKKKRQGKIPEEEIQMALEKFQESKDLAESSMHNLLETEVSHLKQWIIVTSRCPAVRLVGHTCMLSASQLYGYQITFQPQEQSVCRLTWGVFVHPE